MILKCVFPFLIAAAVPAQVVRYDGNAYPEEGGDGWIRLDRLYRSARSLEDGSLVQSPRIVAPGPPVLGEDDFYRRNLYDQAGLSSWVLSWRMDTDGPLAPGAVAPASIVGGGITGIRYHFTIGEDELVFNRGSQFPLWYVGFEPGFHTFRLELENTGDTGTYSFTIDGQVIDAGVAEGYYPTDDSFVVFGAAAAIEDSVTQWDWIEFGAPSDASEPIPAVSHWGIAVLTLLVATAGTIVFRPQRRRLPLPQGR